EKSVTADFHFDTVPESVRPEVGAIKRISVAVMLKPRFEGTGDARKPVSLTPNELSKLAEIIKNSVGFTAARNDEVRVENAPASAETVPITASNLDAGSNGLERWTGLVSGLAPPAGVLVLGLVLWVALKRLSSQQPAVISATPTTPVEQTRSAR